ncbi:hypothetical protein SLE2022_136720 [Rubroshorea leprosula]
MAVQKHSILSAIVVLLLAIKMASSQPAPAPASPIPNVKSLEEPRKLSATEELFMRSCSKHPVTEECGKAIWKLVFTDPSKDEHLSAECCLQLYDFGFECHSGLVELIMSSPYFLGYKVEVRERSQNIKNCGFRF